MYNKDNGSLLFEAVYRSPKFKFPPTYSGLASSSGHSVENWGFVRRGWALIECFGDLVPLYVFFWCLPAARCCLHSSRTACHTLLQTWRVSQSQAGTSETLSSFLSEAIHAKCIVTEMKAGKDTTSMAVQCYLAGTESNGRQGNRGRLGACACCVLRHLSLVWELCGTRIH